MKIVYLLINSLIVLEFFYIMYLEMFALNSNTSKKIFQINNQDLENEKIVTLFNNQGIYNGIFALLMLYGLCMQDFMFMRIMNVSIIMVASYGAYSSNKEILLKQGGLSILALLISLFI